MKAAFRPLRRGLRVLACTLLSLAGASLAAASDIYSSYEQEIIAEHLARLGRVAELQPEGKRISGIDIVRLEVLDESDPVPDFLNVLHATTRERVIRRELLFREGERFSIRRVDETARNLRALRQVSLVLLVPMADGADRVRVLVITKDVWSLRLNSNFRFGSDGLSYLLLNPSEENVFGTHGSVGGIFILRPYTYAVGLVASHNRVWGTRFAATASASLVLSRETGRVEGSFGKFAYSLPQYSEEQRWAFSTGVVWADTIERVSFQVDRGSPFVGLAYDRERYLAATEVTRSFGVAHKLDLSFGAEADRAAYRARIPAGTDPEVARAFTAREVPSSDTRLSPYAQLESYEARYLKTIELETLGLQEDFRLGYAALLRGYVASTAVGSSRDLVGVVAGASYTLALADGLVRGTWKATLEYAAAQRHDALTELGFRIATPRVGPGRLIFDTFVADRFANYLNRRYAIGGDGRLRGYPVGDPELGGRPDQRGADAWASNLEFRSAGISIFSAQCGVAAFYDVGDAADRLENLDLKQSVGLGVRVLLPQANRYVFRVDWGFPLSPGYESWPGAVFVTFEQAFAMPGVGVADVTATLLQ